MTAPVNPNPPQIGQGQNELLPCPFRQALGLLLSTRDCWYRIADVPEIPEQISARFDIPLPLAQRIHDLANKRVEISVPDRDIAAAMGASLETSPPLSDDVKAVKKEGDLGLKEASSVNTSPRQNERFLATLIARAIFEAGDEGNSPCTRIQFKGGKWPDGERNQGGIGEWPLVGIIQRVLSEHDGKQGADQVNQTPSVAAPVTPKSEDVNSDEWRLLRWIYKQFYLCSDGRSHDICERIRTLQEKRLSVSSPAGSSTEEEDKDSGIKEALTASEVTRQNNFRDRLEAIYSCLKGRYPFITTTESGLDAAAWEREALRDTLAMLEFDIDGVPGAWPSKDAVARVLENGRFAMMEHIEKRDLSEHEPKSDNASGFPKPDSTTSTPSSSTREGAATLRDETPTASEQSTR